MKSHNGSFTTIPLILLGGLLTSKAEDPKSDQGNEISKLEKKEIMEAIKNLEDKIMKIKITVDQK